MPHKDRTKRSHPTNPRNNAGVAIDRNDKYATTKAAAREIGRSTGRTDRMAVVKATEAREGQARKGPTARAKPSFDRRDSPNNPFNNAGPSLEKQGFGASNAGTNAEGRARAMGGNTDKVAAAGREARAGMARKGAGVMRKGMVRGKIGMLMGVAAGGSVLLEEFKKYRSNQAGSTKGGPVRRRK